MIPSTLQPDSEKTMSYTTADAFRHPAGRLLTMAALALAGCSAQSELNPPEPAWTPGSGWAEELVRLETGTGTIHGTLVVPAGRGPHPAAVIIAGSGPTDRNGNSAILGGENNSLKLLAEGLAERGVASVRFDKRGIAGSAAAGPSEADLRFEMYVDDAAAWFEYLDSDPRLDAVALVGHSEGSAIGMIAAQRVGAEAFVSIAGIARGAAEVLRDQLRPQLTPELWEESERILTELEAGRTVDTVPPQLFILYRPSVQPYLISWLRYVPAEEIGKLDAAVLIAQGTTDIQVGVAEAEALRDAHPDAELLIVEGMNHVLKLVPADPAAQRASYTDPSLPVAPELIERTADHIRSAADVGR